MAWPKPYGIGAYLIKMTRDESASAIYQATLVVDKRLKALTTSYCYYIDLNDENVYKFTNFEFTTTPPPPREEWTGEILPLPMELEVLEIDLDVDAKQRNLKAIRLRQNMASSKKTIKYLHISFSGCWGEIEFANQRSGQPSLSTDRHINTNVV